MPKENTHLYFAHQVVEVLPDDSLVDLIRREMGCFYFGSVIPDSFYYAKSRETQKISEILHGRNGELTNEFAFDLLKKAKETRSEKDLVFALGFITHCVLDIVFHPVIYYFSGNYYDSDKKKADDAIYLHRHLETALDARVNQSFYFDKLIRLSELDYLSFDEVLIKKFKISKTELLSVLKRKAMLLRLLHHDWLFYILYFLFEIGIVKRPNLLGIFYGNLRHEDRVLPELLKYRDLRTGEPLETTVQELFHKARRLAVDRLNVAYEYYLGNIHHEEAARIIRGESLSLGVEGASVSEIKYFYNT